MCEHEWPCSECCACPRSEKRGQEGDLEQGWESDIISASHVVFQNHSMWHWLPTFCLCPGFPLLYAKGCSSSLVSVMAELRTSSVLSSQEFTGKEEAHLVLPCNPGFDLQDWGVWAWVDGLGPQSVVWSCCFYGNVLIATGKECTPWFFME